MTNPTLLGCCRCTSLRRRIRRVSQRRRGRRRNAPFPAFWDSAALTDRPDEEAGLSSRSISRTSSTCAAGTNVLAIHGLNDGAGKRRLPRQSGADAAEETIDLGSGELLRRPDSRALQRSRFPGRFRQSDLLPPERLFVDPFSLSFTTDDPGAVIRYTLDGSDPSETNGTDYTAPLSIDTSRAFAPGSSSRVSRRAPWDRAVHAPRRRRAQLRFQSAARRRGHLRERDQHDLARRDPRRHHPATGGRASIIDPPEYEGYAGIRLEDRAPGFPKKQYFLETWDENREDLDESFLGLPAESDWILNGPYSDKSLMRNVLSYKWSNEIGRYAVRTRFVETSCEHPRAR